MKDKHNTKNKIVDAMYKLIGVEGYEKASMGKICDSIGITKAAAYYYFKSKEDIFVEIVKRIYQDDNVDNLMKMDHISSAEEFKTQLVNFGLELIDAYEKDSELRKVCYEIDIQTYRMPRIKELVDKGNWEMNLFILKILEKGVSFHLCHRDTINLQAQYLQTIMTGLDKSILFEYPINAKEVWEYSITQLFSQGAMG